MGYCVTMDVSGITLSKENASAALVAIKDLQKLPDQMSGGSYSGGEATNKWYAWVDNRRLEGASTLKDALRAWRYDAYEDVEGNITVESFIGEKLGDDTILWKALAPFTSDGTIFCEGEDGSHWKWEIKAGKFKELSGKVVYEDDN